MLELKQVSAPLNSTLNSYLTEMSPFSCDRSHFLKSLIFTNTLRPTFHFAYRNAFMSDHCHLPKSQILSFTTWEGGDSTR